MYFVENCEINSQVLGKAAASNVVHEVGTVGLQMPVIYLKTLAQLVFKKLFHRRQIFFLLHRTIKLHETSVLFPNSLKTIAKYETLEK